MPQRVEYESMPNTRPEQVPAKLHSALSFGAGAATLDFKAYRAHLRELGIWDKAKAEAMMSIVDVAWDRSQVTLGAFAKRIVAADDEEGIQTLLFERLRDENILLVKYVFDALDVENGGRLHSDNELYRMVTSYVYPGEYITLPAFRAWTHWMASAGVLKVVGIRWALTDRAKEHLVSVRHLDVEEILEDLADEDASNAADPVESIAPLETAPVPARVEEAAPVEAAPAAPVVEEEEELPDAPMPPEAEPPSEEDIARAEAEFIAAFGDVDRPEAPQPRAQHTATPVVGLASLEPAGVVAAQADLPLIAAQLTAAWDEGTQWPSYTSIQLGVDVTEARDASELLVELGVIAHVIEGLAVQPQVFSFVAHLRAQDFFGALSSGGLADALDALDISMTCPAHQSLAERLIHAHGIASRASRHPELLDEISALATPSEAVFALYEGLLGGLGREASFWVLRELVRAERLPASFQGCAVVPTRRLLHHAHALGIVPRTDLDTLEDLVVASCAVAVNFGPESGYGEALETMDRLVSLSSQGF